MRTSPALAPDQATGWYGSVDYLMWWVKGNDVPPLLTTQLTPADFAGGPTVGGLADPNSTVLFGGGPVQTPNFNGLRVNLGHSLCEGWAGIEFGGLYLPRRASQFRVSAPSVDVPALALPFTNAIDGTPSAALIAGINNGFTQEGKVSINSSTELWGAESNGSLTIMRALNSRIDVLGGFRYLGMKDAFSIDAVTTSFGGGATYDRYIAENHFYGGQLGARFAIENGPYALQLVTKVALGVTNEHTDVSGNALVPANIAALGIPQVAGGFYSAGTNLGSSTRNTFAVVPEVGLNLSYQICNNVALTAGYTFLYWSRVARTGDLINTTVNPNLLPTFGGSGDGPRQPARTNDDNDFFAHGFNFGLTFNF